MNAIARKKSSAWIVCLLVACVVGIGTISGGVLLAIGFVRGLDSARDVHRESLAIAEDATPTNQPIKIRDIELLSAYNFNEAAADAQYTNKNIETLASGYVDKDEAGRYFMADYADLGKHVLRTSICYFLPEDAKKLASIQTGPGIAILVQGVCRGKSKHGRAVTIENCRIISTDRVQWNGTDFVRKK